jgi:hypothetical protein
MLLGFPASLGIGPTVEILGADISSEVRRRVHLPVHGVSPVTGTLAEL